MQLGTGTTISFASGFLAEILDVRPPAASRGKVDTTHMLSTPTREFLPTVLHEWGEAEIDMGFDPGAEPPLTGNAQAVTITYPDGETWSFNGWLSRYESTVPLEDKMTATCAIQVSGSVTINGGS